jgi:hypothetical protein
MRRMSRSLVLGLLMRASIPAFNLHMFSYRILRLSLIVVFLGLGSAYYILCLLSGGGHYSLHTGLVCLRCSHVGHILLSIHRTSWVLYMTMLGSCMLSICGTSSSLPGMPLRCWCISDLLAGLGLLPVPPLQGCQTRCLRRRTFLALSLCFWAMQFPRSYSY